MDKHTERLLKKAKQFLADAEAGRGTATGMSAMDRCRRYVRRTTYRRLNARRAELIRDLVRNDGLGPTEAAEYAELKAIIFRICRTAYPLPKPEFRPEGG